MTVDTKVAKSQSQSRKLDLRRIDAAFRAAASLIRRFDRTMVQCFQKENGDPVTTLDREMDRLLRAKLLRRGEGWLSEESPDNRGRLNKKRVWIVDPLDGTKEFMSGIPEWAISIGLAEDSQAVAGGVLNPATGEKFLGSRENGLITTNSKGHREELPAPAPTLLVSRREFADGKWAFLESFVESKDVRLIPVGSVAYRLARVAVGLADATCTLESRNEWDVVGGVALVEAAGGRVLTIGGEVPRYNRSATLLPGLIALAPNCNPKAFDVLSRCLMAISGAKLERALRPE